MTSTTSTLVQYGAACRMGVALKAGGGSVRLLPRFPWFIRGVMTWAELTMGMVGFSLSGSPERLVSFLTSHSWAVLVSLFTMVKNGKGTKAVRELRKVRKDLKLKNGNGIRRGRPVSRRNATIVLAQGAVAAPRRNFGSGKANGNGPRALLKCLDARLPRTLGLPRAVGPYTVIRTTRLHKSSAQFVLFSPFYYAADEKWWDWCGIESVNPALDVTGTHNTQPIQMPMNGLGSACEVVPAAITVQVMNPASLQSANGVFAMARVNQQLMLGSTPAGITYEEMAARVISFYAPRMLTGGKLALRGVKCSGYPLDMSDYSNFAPIIHNGLPFTWVNSSRPAALSPIVFVQENTEPQDIEFMITIEWRVRFDPGNPATASHTYHDTLPDEAWNGIIKLASALGHGVEELSEDVAQNGADAVV